MDFDTLLQIVREHQEATDTDDSEMLLVMLDIIVDKGVTDDIEDMIVDRLERLPGDC